MQLILASRSPRRAALLREAGYAFEAMSPPFVDPPTPRAAGDARAAQHATELARLKAESLRPTVREPAVILAADTICVGPDGVLVGTPEVEEEALGMLRSFAGKTHEVVTGIALLRREPGGDDRWWFDADTAAVTWGQIDDDTLRAYVGSGEWRGKAGGYNLFDRERAGWPIAVDGDAGTVVGLSLRRVAPMLAEAGVEPNG